MNTQERSSIMESLLFVHGEPMPLHKLAKVIGCTAKEAQEAIAGLHERYLAGECGFAILEKEGAVQLVTKAEHATYVQKLIKKTSDEKLSQASAEVLSIIAYRGPISRNEIEVIRGVNCSYSVRNLLVRGLIERIESSKNARTYIYSISFEALRALGINSIKDLPEYASLSQDPRLRSVGEPQAQEEE